VNSTNEIAVPVPYPQVSTEFDVGMSTFTSYRRYTSRHLAWVDAATVFREDRIGWDAGVKMKKAAVFLTNSCNFEPRQTHLRLQLLTMATNDLTGDYTTKRQSLAQVLQDVTQPDGWVA